MISPHVTSFQEEQSTDVGVLDVCEAPFRRPAGPRRILVIDDQADLRECVTTILEEAGHIVQEAESGDEGVGILHVSPIDLVITDLQMPGLSGWDVARAVRSIQPGLPVIAMTGCPELVESKTEFTALFEGVLTKPFRSESLLGLVTALLSSNPAGLSLEG